MSQAPLNIFFVVLHRLARLTVTRIRKRQYGYDQKSNYVFGVSFHNLVNVIYLQNIAFTCF
jgi:hypothetical protein